MTVYNAATLRNLYTHKQLEKAESKQHLSVETIEKIKTTHPVDLYTPNLFVKIGLGILTSFVCLCIVGLLALLFNIEGSPAIFMSLIAAVCYVILEIMTGKKKHYNSGVDNVLMATTVILITTGIMFNYNGSRSEMLLSLVIFVTCLWLTVRFADALAAIATIIALLSFVFYAYLGIGSIALSTFPFLLIIISTLLYKFFNKNGNNKQKVIYLFVWKSASVVALLAIYFWGNYYIINSLTQEASHLYKMPHALSWFLWCSTFVLPLLYIASGIKDKDLLLLRTGTLLTAMSILTWRYYYSILSMQTAMVIAGILLVGISYFFMKYLKLRRHGFVFDDNTVEENKFRNLEGFAIGHMQGTAHPNVPETQFGGGSFGGAGAGTKY
jgi:hypothetical protein